MPSITKIVLIKFLNHEIHSVRIYIGSAGADIAAAEFEEYRKVPYAEFLDRLDVGEAAADILPAEVVGTVIFQDDAVPIWINS